MPELRLERADILRLLEGLGAKLELLNETEQVYVAGGAAMVLLYGRASATADVDTVVRRDGHLVRLADEVAVELGMVPGWLTTSVRPFVPSRHDDEAVTYVFGGLTVRLASERPMLAMKMRAMRVKDFEDIAILINRLRLDSEEEVADVVEEFFDEDSVPPEHRDDTLLAAQRMLRLARARR
ncbi:hypothetical protein A9Z40_15980 [Microbacterium arborescens]|uniref:Uncharacterized protein n=1 Tax=Microbacterium arborescens TaxID=33883 RepID=A0ABX2WJ74_9MICO|nr:DUF6036 family nucleotidyltransferase [Microbacterium arborescens]OAZ41708.1 hypothetical protein A9Z40_15980 [Microbacterium arborescens]